MRKLNPSTFQDNTPEHLETVIGDEKQNEFYPRVKLKAWDNEANLSVGVMATPAGASVKQIRDHKKGDRLEWRKAGTTARFYNNIPDKKPATYIRVLHNGAMDPIWIAAEYELGHNMGWDQPTIRVHWSNVPSLQYYGFYREDFFIDQNKLDIPAARVAPQPAWNDPIYLDAGLPLIDIEYDEQRDDLSKLDASMKRAVTEVMSGYGITVLTKPGVASIGKLFFRHEDKLVKFFSTGFIGGHYYFYINLDNDYNKAYDYYLPGKNKPKHDQEAYGIRAIKPDLPDSVIHEILDRYAELYGLPLNYQSYTNEEQRMMEQLVKVHQDENWIRNAERDDPYMFPAPTDGLEFDVVLDSKPATNQYDFSITTKNLEFYYQPHLTAAEKFEDDPVLGHKMSQFRSPHVEGSYAVYHPTKQHNAYKTGKAFHIYRPVIRDTVGLKTFGELKIDKENETLKVIIPENFLNQANYPITIDPTIGYTTAGASQATAGNTILGQSVTGASGTVTDMVGYINFVASPRKVAIYNGSDSTLLKGSTEDSTAPTSGGGWRTFTGFSNQVISAVTYYFVLWSTQGGYGAADSFFYDSTSGKTGETSSVTYVGGNSPTGWPSPASFTSQTDRQYSIYINYVAITAVSVSDPSTVTDVPIVRVESYVNRSDQTDITDIPVASTDSLQIAKSDDTTVTDVATEQVDSFVSRSDDATVTDVPTLATDNLQISRFDETTVTDVATLVIGLPIDKSDDTTVTDVSNVATDPLQISKSDDITVTDVPTVSVVNPGETNVSKNDDTTVTDVPLVATDALSISRSDDSTINDIPFIATDNLIVTKSDQVDVIEGGAVSVQFSITKAEDITVTEAYALLKTMAVIGFWEFFE